MGADFFIRKPFEYSLQHCLLTLCQPLRAAGRRRIAGGRGDDGTGHCRIEPHLSGNHLSDGLYQAARRTVLQKHSVRTILKRAQHHRIAHAGRHHQDATAETMSVRPVQKLRALLVAEIVIQQNDVNIFELRQRQCLARGGTGTHDVEVRLCLKKPAEALAEQAVIVDQQYLNFAAHSYHCCSLA